MAGRFYTVQQKTVAVGSGATVTVLMVKAAANREAIIHEVSVSFDGVLGTAQKCSVEVERPSTDGTMSANTPNPLDTLVGASVFTAFHTASAEPTAGVILMAEQVHLQGGYTWRPPTPLVCRNSERIAIRCINGTTATNVHCRMVVEE